jgi:hypothetical protein
MVLCEELAFEKEAMDLKQDSQTMNGSQQAIQHF